jgi:CxxC motif-containing protein
MPVKELICIGCPLGCPMEICYEDADILSINGHSCKRGETYAINEFKNPLRIITTTVEIHGGSLKMLPVKSKGTIPKKLIPACIKLLKNTSVNAPVKCGDVILKDVLGTGTDIVAAADSDTI